METQLVRLSVPKDDPMALQLILRLLRPSDALSDFRPSRTPLEELCCADTFCGFKITCQLDTDFTFYVEVGYDLPDANWRVCSCRNTFSKGHFILSHEKMRRKVQFLPPCNTLILRDGTPHSAKIIATAANQLTAEIIDRLIPNRTKRIKNMRHPLAA